ncbi:TPA: hypothetical protein I7745_20005 [Vibrio vulnificus]|nr:hypothetical protein [Vibrio vulnificus]HAS8119998.1 hypothetical protein [Vibrio vulnificus]HAS8533196.1 hypothetical protein [Vibrio vulnificus]
MFLPVSLLSHSVILANAGSHCIVSAVAWFWHFILRVVGFAFVVICGGECVANTRLLARVDEWIPVCTGMTGGWCRSILSLGHPCERGDPSYSERRGLVLAFHCRCFCQFRYSLTPSSSRTRGSIV